MLQPFRLCLGKFHPQFPQAGGSIQGLDQHLTPTAGDDELVFRAAAFHGTGIVEARHPDRGLVLERIPEGFADVFLNCLKDTNIPQGRSEDKRLKRRVCRGSCRPFLPVGRQARHDTGMRGLGTRGRHGLLCRGRSRLAGSLSGGLGLSLVRHDISFRDGGPGCAPRGLSGQESLVSSPIVHPYAREVNTNVFWYAYQNDQNLNSGSVYFSLCMCIRAYPYG